MQARPAHRVAATACLAAFPLVACAPRSAGPPPAPDAAHRAEVEAWRAERDERLRSDTGWLSLAGLFWLAEGENSVGAGPANDLVLPGGKAPERLGTLRLADGRVAFEAAPGAEVRAGGKPVTRLELTTDAAGSPTVLEAGSLVFYVIERGERIGVRLKDRDSELLARFEGMEHYPTDPRWLLEARFEPYAKPKTLSVPNAIGGAFEEPSPGRLVFEVAGESYSLEPIGEPGEDLFIVFGDRTNGRTTYGGGRFLYADWPDASGRVELDFNKAYNPPCVFTPWATCPLPTPENKLALAVEAGELTFSAGAAAH